MIDSKNAIIQMFHSRKRSRIYRLPDLRHLAAVRDEIRLPAIGWDNMEIARVNSYDSVH